MLITRPASNLLPLIVSIFRTKETVLPRASLSFFGQFGYFFWKRL
jgi:hypothetical protein